MPILLIMPNSARRVGRRAAEKNDHPRGLSLGGLLCSRHNPAFLQRTGSGSHLYTANLHTLRSVHRVEDLLALVGTHILWSPHPPLLYLDYITLLVICQALFLPSLIFFREDTWREPRGSFSC